ncbi:Imm45 family immunity protein [Cognatiyoonia sp. IB215446]|uniref:Imm45 family immunity protein n=1 Tax=Cognatiyoonia sp. IB215446 TaxID=3097355 RepID=UPI002A16FC11|nr:Imm45 family immunity protein [Cognatiyoonia sp. IB215446]MDX8349566.1 Imm45 family immunity protein [Cognatiyoonia sp. IB215446]
MTHSFGRNLCDFNDDEVLTRGMLFRFPARQPYESYVDFMLYQPIEADVSMGLVVSSGIKAGLIAVHLPSEAKVLGRGDCISAGWLKSNWSTWVYSDCKMTDVAVLPPRSLTNVGVAG